MKKLIKLSLAASLAYVTLGDSVLPETYGSKSQEVRGNINQYLVSLFPDNKLEALKKSEFMVKYLEEGNSSSPSSNL